MNDHPHHPPLPRLIHNSDGDSTTLMTYSPPITPAECCRDIDEIAGTAVEVFTNSLGRGDDTFSHRTNFGDVYGEGITEWPKDDRLKYVEGMALNTRALLDAGIDINELLAEHAHAHGMQFWPALRMNDIHEDDGSRWDAFRSNFKRQHPELLIGSPYPKRGGGYPAEDFTWAFDYAHQAVRDRKAGLVLETCERYNIDGFELDFQRGPWFFKDGHESDGAPLLTDMLRQIRQGTRRIAEQKGKPFTLMVRVPPTVQMCLAIGLDVPTWIKEELADLIVLMHGGYLDMSADVRGFVEMARGKQCGIGAGLEHIAKGYGHAGADMLHAAALSYWQQGASALYLFNYDCHRQQFGELPYSPEEVQVLHEIHDPSLIARRNKRYTVPLDMELRTPSAGGAFPLPVELSRSGDSESFTIHVGDDVESARRDDAIDRMWLRITCAGRQADAPPINVSLNRQSLGADPMHRGPSCATIAYPNVPVAMHDNQITITLTQTPTQPLRIEGIELMITYRPRT